MHMIINEKEGIRKHNRLFTSKLPWRWTGVGWWEEQLFSRFLLAVKTCALLLLPLLSIDCPNSGTFFPRFLYPLPSPPTSSPSLLGPRLQPFLLLPLAGYSHSPPPPWQNCSGQLRSPRTLTLIVYDSITVRLPAPAIPPSLVLPSISSPAV